MRTSFFLSLSVCLVAAACGASTTDTSSSGDAGVATDAASGDAATGGDAAATPGAVCKTDADCNDDPAMSSLAGTCDEGRCRCRTGLFIVPGGHCRAGVKGVGVSCTQKSDCYAGLDCVEFTVHPAGGGCNVLGKQCAIACSGSSSACVDALGPGTMCFAGCSGPSGICALTP